MAKRCRTTLKPGQNQKNWILARDIGQLFLLLADLAEGQGVGLGQVEKMLEVIQASKVTDRELQERLIAKGQLRRLLRGELEVRKVVERVAELLTFLSLVTVPTTQKFVAKDSFDLKKFYLSNNFKSWFLGKTEEPQAETELRCHKLARYARDLEIIPELGGEEKVETTLSQIATLIASQANGEEGTLLVNGFANIFYVRDQNGVLRTVNAHWDGFGWYLNAGPLGRPHEWHDGDRVFSRNSVA